jgi:anti-anti-sigma regulatory factor
MTMLLKLEKGTAAAALQDARAGFEGAPGEAVVDVSAIQRMDAGAVEALDALVSEAEGKAIKVILSGVNPEIYRVLKLVKLAPRVSFVD